MSVCVCCALCVCASVRLCVNPCEIMPVCLCGCAVHTTTTTRPHLDLVHSRHAHQVGKYILENTLLLDAALRFTAADVLINLAQMITPFTSLPELSAPPQQPRARMSTLPVAPTPAPDGDTSDITGPNYPRPPPLAAPVANTHAKRARPATLDGDMRPVTRHAAVDTSASVDVNMPHVEVYLDGGAVENRVVVDTAEEGQAEDRTEEASQGEVNGDGTAKACLGDHEGSHAAETEHIPSSEDPSAVPRAGTMESQARRMLEDASPWGKHAPVYKLSAIAAETSMESLGEDDEEEWEDEEGDPAPAHEFFGAVGAEAARLADSGGVAVEALPQSGREA